MSSTSMRSSLVLTQLASLLLCALVQNARFAHAVHAAKFAEGLSSEGPASAAV